jgi:hypothetical protein
MSTNKFCITNEFDDTGYILWDNAHLDFPSLESNLEETVDTE